MRNHRAAGLDAKTAIVKFDGDAVARWADKFLKFESFG
jgi:sulfur carrier protein ThiS